MIAEPKTSSHALKQAYMCEKKCVSVKRDLWKRPMKETHLLLFIPGAKTSMHSQAYHVCDTAQCKHVKKYQYIWKETYCKRDLWKRPTYSCLYLGPRWVSAARHIKCVTRLLHWQLGHHWSPAPAVVQYSWIYVERLNVSWPIHMCHDSMTHVPLLVANCSCGTVLLDMCDMTHRDMTYWYVPWLHDTRTITGRQPQLWSNTPEYLWHDSSWPIHMHHDSITHVQSGEDPWDALSS